MLKDMIKRGQGDWKVLKRWEAGEQNEAEEEAGAILQHAQTGKRVWHQHDRALCYGESRHNGPVMRHYWGPGNKVGLR